MNCLMFTTLDSENAQAHRTTVTTHENQIFLSVVVSKPQILTRRVKQLTCALVVLSCLAAFVGHTRADVSLTGLKWFAADSAGNHALPASAYTFVPNGGTYVLWVTAGGFVDPFINGPDRNSAGISAPLIPGSHTFSIFTETGLSEGQSVWPGPIPPFTGLNLFFDGNASNPGISVFAPIKLSQNGPFPQFALNSGSTPNLSGGASVSGAGTLTFLDGTTEVALTSYFFSDPRVYNIDRIGNFDATPDGNREYVGQFTLNVTTVPEPGTLSLLCMAMIAFVYSGRQRARKSQAHRSIGFCR